MEPRTIILSGADVRCLDARGSRAEAIAWRDGTIVAVGDARAVELAAGASAERWDGQGATVLPGFIDAHHHPCIAALYGGRVRLTPPAVRNIGELQATLATASASLGDPSRWLVAVEWDELLLAERRPPTRAELDEAVPDRPLFAMHYSCHRALANSRALELAGIGRDTPDPSGGLIVRGRGGIPSGLLVERAMSRVESLARASLVAHDAEGVLKHLGEHYRAVAAAGITRIVDATVPGDLIALYREAARRGLILVPTLLMPVSVGGWLEAPHAALDGPVTGEQDGPLTIGPIKLVFDGAPSCAMCLSVWQALAGFTTALGMSIRRGSLDPVRASLSLSPRLGHDLRIRTGVHLYRGEELRQVIAAAIDRGFAVATHAVGNEAVARALDAYAANRSRLDRGGVPRLEHAWFLDRHLVARIAEVGAAVVSQPHLVTLPASASAPSVPKLRAGAHRWLLDAGVKVAGSSDYPVHGFEPLDGIRSAVQRRTSAGRVYEPDQRLTLDEAIAMYTRVAAEVTGCLDVTGTLEPGKRADLVILDRALGGDDALAGARVRRTVAGGAVVAEG